MIITFFLKFILNLSFYKIKFDSVNVNYNLDWATDFM